MTVYAGAPRCGYLSISRRGPRALGLFPLGPAARIFFSAGRPRSPPGDPDRQASVSDIGWRLVWELPAKPSIEQVSELFFQLKQAFDDFIVMLSAR